MANAVNVNFRMDPDLKRNMEEVCAEMGLSMTTAFTIFAKKVSREHRIPFEVSADPFYSESNINHLRQTLNDKLRASAAKQGIPLIEGNIHSSDVFYRQPSDEKPTYWEKLRDERGCLCVEMESFALFANAQVLGKNAACLLTISDSFVSPEITTAEQRQTSFTNMMKVALGAEY